MGKSYKKKNGRNDDYENDDDWYINGERDKNRKRREMKRLNRALKTKDIDTLLQDDSYGDELENWGDY